MAERQRFATTSVIKVACPLASVGASFERGGNRCLNQQVVEEFFSPTASGRSVSNCRPQIVRANGTVTLNMLRTGTTAVFGPKGEQRVFMAEARAVAGGTAIRMAGPSLNYDDVFRAVPNGRASTSDRGPGRPRGGQAGSHSSIALPSGSRR